MKPSPELVKDMINALEAEKARKAAEVEEVDDVEEYSGQWAVCIFALGKCVTSRMTWPTKEAAQEAINSGMKCDFFTCGSLSWQPTESIVSIFPIPVKS